MADLRRRTDMIDPWPSTGGGREGGHLGTMFLATILGVGVGLLAAPQPGARTRSQLRKRLAAMGEDIGEEIDHLEKRSRPLRHAVRDRAEELRRRGRKKYEETLEELEDFEDEDEIEEEDEDSGVLGTVLTVGAGLAAAAYFLTSDRAAPARERVREAAATVRDEAEARWSKFQSRRGNGHPTTESGARIDPADSAPQTS
jgi:gas vesicle protein